MPKRLLKEQNVSQARKGLTLGLLWLLLMGTGCGVARMGPGEYFREATGIAESERIRKGVSVQTPHGYSVQLYEGAEVLYGRESWYVYQIKPPYIELSKHKSKPGYTGGGGMRTTTEITSLDMFRE